MSVAVSHVPLVVMGVTLLVYAVWSCVLSAGQMRPFQLFSEGLTFDLIWCLDIVILLDCFSTKKAFS